MKNFFKEYRYVILISAAVLAVLAFIELHNGSLPWGPDGKFGWWDGDIYGSENSQRVADVYSFTHVIHGILIYLGLWIVARRVPAKYRFVAAVVLEAGWEILENSPIIINRYRAETISLGYVGDSVLNSVVDVVMMAIGFIIAKTARIWVSVLLVVGIEVGLLFWVRDNLTINIIMLVHPIEAIKTWQAAIR